MKLAYDVGVFDGADTAHYLALGYRVIGIEASPDLCKTLRQRFASEISDGRYTLLNIAIGESEGLLPFYISENQQWNSFDLAAATRDGKKATRIDVPTKRMSEVIAAHGVPEYMKVDIEGADYACLRGMGDTPPTHVSFETWGNKLECDEMILHLASRGYTKFSLIQQRNMKPVTIAPAGTLAHIKWSARQWLRWQLRNRPMLHKALAGGRSSLRWAKTRRHERKKPGQAAMLHHTLTPMEHAEGWYSVPEFLWLWRNIVAGGEVDSSWYDVHASR